MGYPHSPQRSQWNRNETSRMKRPIKNSTQSRYSVYLKSSIITWNLSLFVFSRLHRVQNNFGPLYITWLRKLQGLSPWSPCKPNTVFLGDLSRHSGLRLHDYNFRLFGISDRTKKIWWLCNEKSGNNDTDRVLCLVLNPFFSVTWLIYQFRRRENHDTNYLTSITYADSWIQFFTHTKYSQICPTFAVFLRCLCNLIVV